MANTTPMITQAPADYDKLESGESSLQGLENILAIVTVEASAEKEDKTTVSSLTGTYKANDLLYFDILISRKKVVGIKGSRAKITNNLLSVDNSSFLPTELLQDKTVLESYSIYSTHSKHPNS